MPFSSLGLSEHLQSALNELGYGNATPIQEQAIPMIMTGNDLLAAAETGSGKTAAFALPVLQFFSENVEERGTPRYLILTPTRELADQVGASFQRYGNNLPTNPKMLIAFGGVAIEPQIEAAQSGVDIIVATPGRLLDLIEREAIDLSKIEMFVLDEADRLLALGFADELNKVMTLMPSTRQNLLFSATFPDAVVSIADALLNHPQKIQLEAQSQPVESIKQRAIEVESDTRTALFRHLLKTEQWSRVLLFVGTKRRASNLTAKLSKHGIQVSTLHGDLKQDLRSKALENFKVGKIQVLIATDLVARGIHIDQLPCVVNYDLPRSPTDYTHRIGRTGRIGESGVAVSFITQEEHKHFQLIEKRCGVSLDRERIQGFEPIKWDPDAIPTPGAPVKGKRKSKKDRKREAAALGSRKVDTKKAEAKTSEPKAAPEPEETKPVRQPQPKPIETTPIPPVKAQAPKDKPEEEVKSSEVPDSSPWAQALKKIKSDKM